MSYVSATIVVCTRRFDDELASTLGALIQHAPEAAEILVVRSGTPIGSPVPASIEPWFSNGVLRSICVAQDGSARARAAGLREASTEVVVWLDDDARPRSGWYRELIAPFSNPGVGAVGGTIIPDWPDGRPPAWLPRRLAIYFGERRAGPNVGHHPFGANMAVKRSAALEVGELDPALGPSGSIPGLHEETELCERLSAAGYRIEEAPGAIVDHSIRPEQVSVRWVLRRAWHHGRSDLLRDLPKGRADTPTRIFKLLGLIASWPVSLLHPRAAVYVTTRVLVNVAYLRYRVGTSRSGARSS
jgi:GT2 family glycosyltransferase